MEYIKIKTKHLLFTDFTESEIGTLIKIQLLVAHFERILTQEELLKHCNNRWLASVEHKLGIGEASVRHVMGKVLEDVHHVQGMRIAGNKRVRKHRDKEECNTLHKKTVTEHIREDKIKEDNTPISPLPENLINEIMASWTKTFPDQFKKDGTWQTGYVIARRRELENFPDRESIDNYLRIYHRVGLTEENQVKRIQS